MMTLFSRLRERGREPPSSANPKVFAALYIFLLLVSIFAYVQLYSKNPTPISGVADFKDNTPESNYSSGNIISRLLGWDKKVEIELRQRDPPFKILFWTTWYGYEADSSSEFVIPVCANEFIITSNKSELESADALIFQLLDLPRSGRRKKRNEGSSQYPPTRDINVPWILASQEATIQHSLSGRYIPDGTFNWTWSSRTDSLIHPNFTEMFSRSEEPDKRWVYGSQFSIEFLRNKSSSAWVVSNCGVIQSERNELVSGLSQLGIEIDSYGSCGRPCPKGEACFAQLGKKYKFYMALENSLCEDYITEKINHGLLHGMVPVVYAMGNVGLVAPPNNSYINVLDFANLTDLADRLKFLDQNPQEYFKYFEWRQYYNANVTESPRYQCHLWRKVKEYTKKLGTDEDSKYRHTYVNLNDWHSKFYNPTFGKLCKVCLEPHDIHVKEPSLNRQIMYNDSSRCL